MNSCNIYAIKAFQSLGMKNSIFHSVGTTEPRQFYMYLALKSCNKYQKNTFMNI